MSRTRWASRRKIAATVLAGIPLVIAAGLVYLATAEKSNLQLVRDGQAALSRSDFRRAADCAERVIQRSPQSASGWKLLAEAFSRDNQLDRACVVLEEFAAQNPREASRLGLRLGREWMLQNRIRDANRVFRLCERLDFDALEALEMLQQIAAVTGHSRETVRCILKLLRRGSFNQSHLMVMTSLVPMIRDAGRLRAILEAEPENKSPRLALSIEEWYSLHYVRAERTLLEIIAAEPDDFEAQGTLAELYAANLPEKFYDWHLRIPSQITDDARIWSARGKWLAHIGKTTEAVRCLHEALVREPEQLSTTALLGQLLKSVNEIELGNAFSERSLGLRKIIDLNGRLTEQPASHQFYLAMIEELEATGRLWEAWGWCIVREQSNTRDDPVVQSCKYRIERQLYSELPQTHPDSLPGKNFNWDRFPLPDWRRLQHFDPKPNLPSDHQPSGIRFENRAHEVGLDFRFVNSYSPVEGRKLFESMGAGVAVLDYDGDGWPDVYFPQGSPSPAGLSNGPSDALYRNQAGERYQSESQSAGIKETSYSQGVTAGDYNNDGFPDLYVANFGRNTLYRNNGDGTFTDATDEAGLRQRNWTVSCAMADLNADGMPELFDVNYVKGKELLTKTCRGAKGRLTACRPSIFDPELDTVLENLGDGRFRERQSEAGLDLPQGMGLGLVIADFNDDNRLDLFIANDMTPNYLLINETPGSGQPIRFRDEAVLRGVAVDEEGLAQACMGVACADINRDRQPDLFVTNYYKESNTLYLSQQGWSYRDDTQRAGLRSPSFDLLGFGTQFLDADRDGWYDLVIANGHIDEFDGEPFRMKAQFFHGRPDGRFEELFASEAGSLFDISRLGRGLALLDWNRDGRTDFVVTDLDGPVVLAVNQSESQNHSFRLKLIGTRGSRDAIGAKVKVNVGGGDERFYQIMAGDGYESSNERDLTICTGTAEQVQHLEIRWPSGVGFSRENLAIDGDYVVIEDPPRLIRRNLAD